MHTCSKTNFKRPGNEGHTIQNNVYLCRGKTGTWLGRGTQGSNTTLMLFLKLSRGQRCASCHFFLKSSLGHTSLCMHGTTRNRRGLEKHESWRCNQTMLPNPTYMSICPRWASRVRSKSHSKTTESTRFRGDRKKDHLQALLWASWVKPTPQCLVEG